MALVVSRRVTLMHPHETMITPTDYDTPWKGALEACLDECTVREHLPLRLLPELRPLAAYGG
jgi:hypothetical protein